MKKLLFIFLFFTSVCYAQTFDNNVLFNKNVIFKGKTIASNDSIRFTNNGDTMTIGVRNNHGYITCYTCDSIQIYPPVIGSGGGGSGAMRGRQITDSLNTLDPILVTNSVRAQSHQTATVLGDNGQITLIDSLGTGPLYLDQSSTTIFSGKIIIPSAQVKTLKTVPVPIVIASTTTGGSTYTIVITNLLVYWRGGANSYEGITSLYAYANGSSSNQYQVDCPSTINPYVQRGVATQALIGNKDNALKNGDIYLTTDFDSSNGDSQLVPYIWGIYINFD